ncbi:MAG TPA: hypothetical protein VK589_12320 [Chryseolinea sp.]|nr:hypothetical protein [Chryseolinea sp.]
MRFVILIALAGFLFSCSAPVQLQKDYSLNKRILLPFRVDSVVFVDRRTDTLTKDLKLPLLTAKPREWIVKPGLSEELKREILKMIEDSSNPDGLSTNVIFYVNEAYYKISGNATKVGEHTRFDCELQFKIVESDIFYSAKATAFHDYVGVFNATERHVIEEYKVTVRNSTFNALTQAEKAFD